MPIAMCWSSAAARRGWRRRWRASATGARVILCDEQAELGGSLLAETDVTIDGGPAPDWLREAHRDAGPTCRVTLLPRTTAFGWYPDNMHRVWSERVTDHLAEPACGLPRERLWHVRAGRVVLATGAIERPMVFPGNDRPGMMLAGAARMYLHRYGVKVGSARVIATADDSAYRAAVDLHDGRRNDRRASSISAHARRRSGRGGARAGHADPMRYDDRRHRGPRPRVIPPSWRTDRYHSLRYDPDVRRLDAVGASVFASRVESCASMPLRAFLPGWPARVRSAGACAGVFDLATCLRDGTPRRDGSDGRSPSRAPGAWPIGPPVAAPHASWHGLRRFPERCDHEGPGASRRMKVLSRSSM